MTSISSSKEPPNDEITNQETGSSNHSHDDEDDPFTFRSRKSYPQRNNRPKLNYRDLERGMYDRHELRQSTWALGGPTLLNRSENSGKHQRQSNYSDDEDEAMDDLAAAATDHDDDEISNNKSNDTKDQMHRRLWCICRKPWDHSRLMLRCDSCSNWYHGDCIGMTKEQARMLDMKGDPFICPPCQGVSQSSNSKPGRSSDESIMIKRKRIDGVPLVNSKMAEKHENLPSNKTTVQSEPVKRPKTGIFFQRDATNERQIHCISPSCSNWAKSGWVYCSAACIRRHINDTLQAIQRGKGANNDNPPAREDILLYESRTKKILDRKLVPKVEDLCTWINQHPSYEIVKPTLRQSILLTADESKTPLNPGLSRSTSVISTTTIPKSPSTSTSSKPKLSWIPVAPSTKSVPIKKAPVPLNKPTSQSTSAASSSVPNTADIRSKVPNALYDKLVMRVSKSGEQTISNDEMRNIVERIEEEMFRVYGKVDNSYKNKFRSLLANISNMTNNFFYKQVISKEVTAKQIVAMKPEDMLPPEEKEKRKDEFEKEVQMIIKAEEQSAEELARRARIKVTRQGLVDNDAVIPVFKHETSTTAEKKVLQQQVSKSVEQSKKNIDEKPKIIKKPENSTTTKPLMKLKKPITSASATTPNVTPSTVAPVVSESATTPTFNEKPVDIIKPVAEELVQPVTSHAESDTLYSVVDLDNDYIEPESPTGIDALLYDDDDDLNHVSILSRPSIISQQQKESPSGSPDYLPPVSTSIRDDYNPLAASKPKAEPPSIYQSPMIGRPENMTPRWRGIINLPDSKMNCQALRTFGDGEYLVADIPEQLGILGRLRISDLWDYVRDSLAVRDVIMLSLISSSANENQIFSRYIETMRQSGRAAVMNKRTEPSTIRDMYILPAETKDCPSTVLSTLSLTSTNDANTLFLVVIGSGKRSMKLSTRPNEGSTSNNLTYKPVSLQEPTSIRDPRLSRNKDPRLAISNQPKEPKPNESSTPIASTEITVNSNQSQSSLDQALKLISDSLQRIRQVSSIDAVPAIMISTLDYLKSHGHEDLCPHFTDEIPAVISKWQTAKETDQKATRTVDDNLNEENMDVDDESDKKQFANSEFNDVDYRFLDQDMDHRIATPIHDQEQRKDSRKNGSLSDPRGTNLDADHRIITTNARQLNE